MKKQKYIILIFIISILAMGILNGCSEKKATFNKNSKEIQPKINLTFFGFKYEALNVTAIEEALHGYMDKYPNILISYDGIKSPEYFDILEKRMKTGNGDDIFMVDHERTLEFRSQKKLADLSDLSTLKNFSNLAKSQMSANGIIDYLPTSISAFGLYCNLDLLKKHGQKIPENIMEFEKICNYFVAQGITPIIANNDISLKTIVLAKSLLPLYQKDNTAREIENFNTGNADLAETLRPGFELVEKMLKYGWVNSNEAINITKTKDDIVLFSKGNQPFMLTGVWAVPRLRNLKPKFKFEVHPYPILKNGNVLVINIDTRISINADSQHLKEAKQFAEYLTQKDILWKFVDSQSSFSPLKQNKLAEDTSIQSIGSYLTNGYSVLGSDDNFEFPIWDMTHSCIIVMLKGDNAQAAIFNMKNQINTWHKKTIKQEDENL